MPGRAALGGPAVDGSEAGQREAGRHRVQVALERAFLAILIDSGRAVCRNRIGAIASLEDILAEHEQDRNDAYDHRADGSTVQFIAQE